MTKADLPDAEKLTLVLDFDRVLGLGLSDWREDDVPEDIALLIQQRIMLRNNKDFDKADEVRKQIEHLGWILEDKGGYSKARKK